MWRRVRWRRVGKWPGVNTLAAIAAIWVVSGWWGVVLSWQIPTGTVRLALLRGSLKCHIDPSQDVNAKPLQWERLSDSGGEGWEWAFGFGRFRMTNLRIMPLWVPWLAVLLPALWLWRLDRRRPPGSCPKCGYDLTANTTGVCPECGAKSGSRAVHDG